MGLIVPFIQASGSEGHKCRGVHFPVVWTENDLAKLLRLSEAGATLMRASAALDRPSSSVQRKARELGFKLPGLRDVRSDLRASNPANPTPRQKTINTVDAKIGDDEDAHRKCRKCGGSMVHYRSGPHPSKTASEVQRFQCLDCRSQFARTVLRSASSLNAGHRNSCT